MPAFSYGSGWVNPYGLSIGETLAHRNDAAAHAAEVIGQAQAHAAEVTGQAFGGAVQGAGQAVAGALTTATDPHRKLEQQAVDANARDVAYQKSATSIAQSLVGPNGEQPTPEAAGSLMTKAGIPVTAQKQILDSLQSAANHHDESIADAGHIAYQVIKSLPPGATADDKAHAASAALGASQAFGVVTPDQSKQVTGALAQGANPMAMALGFMGKSPSGRYKDVIQDETKPVVLAGAPRPGATPATLVSPGGATLASGAAAGVAPLTPEQVALDAATLGTPQETPTAKQSSTAMGLQHPKATGSIDEQLYKAIATGDTTTRDNILSTLKSAADARKDPAAAAQLTAIRNLTQQEAQARLDDRDPQSSKNQQKFEQEYRTVLQRGLSSRSGGLGLEDAKVQQANHLSAIFEQNYDPKTGDYNIPRVQLNELALGLARLTSPGGQAGEGMLKEFQQRTAKGDLAGALTYLTGQPVPANTQAITQMLKDSIERQGKTAETNREGEMNYLRGLAPTDLNEDRRKQLEATSLNPLRQSRLIENSSTGERRLQVSTDGGVTWK